MDIKKLAEEEFPHLIELRRHFHAYPEPSQHEFKTMEFIEMRLEELGISFVRIPKGGVFGFIESGRPGFSVLMRRIWMLCYSGEYGKSVPQKGLRFKKHGIFPCLRS